MDAMLDRALSVEPAGGRGQAVSKALPVVTPFSPPGGWTVGSAESRDGRGREPFEVALPAEMERSARHTPACRESRPRHSDYPTGIPSGSR